MIAQNRKLATIHDSTLIVAVDIASQKHVARAINWRGHILGEPLIFDNRLEGFEVFLQYVRVVLVNPFHVKQTKEFVDNSPTKNDRKDALVIGKLIKDGHFVIPTWPQGDFAELRGLVHLRYQLMKNLQRLHARIRRWLDQYFPEFLDVFPDWESKTALVSLRLFPLPQDVCAYTPEELVRLWREHGVQRAVGLSRARQLRASAERSIGLTQGLHAARLALRFWLQEYDLLQQQLNELEQAIGELLQRIPGAAEMMSIPGVSEMTVAGFLAETGDLRQYRDWRQIRKLAGLNIVENQSGKHVGKTRISKRGRARLRALLYRCVFVLVAKNAEFRTLHRYYTKERPNPLKPKQSLVALCCRLIRLLYVLGTRKIRLRRPAECPNLRNPLRRQVSSPRVRNAPDGVTNALIRSRSFMHAESRYFNPFGLRPCLGANVASSLDRLDEGMWWAQDSVRYGRVAARENRGGRGTA